ncbi:uncharacterized protein LOC111051696 [Nilaparvata lugens]|uniref:uncharacterized protein LOC111051696 n=1 Tax=Nilaparvata lugens TaxID=108931 RepID=UPI000B980DF8|nr:uncharacterized protein LOC111051696 [Nilaparvata lugens]
MTSLQTCIGIHCTRSVDLFNVFNRKQRAHGHCFDSALTALARLEYFLWILLKICLHNSSSVRPTSTCISPSQQKFNRLENMYSEIIFMLIFGVVSSYAKPREFNRDDQFEVHHSSHQLIRPNRPTFPRNSDDLGLIDIHQLVDPLNHRSKRSPQDGERHSVSATASRTEPQMGRPAQNSVRGDYSYNLWRGGKNGATLNANTFYQRNWGAGPKRDYGGGLSVSVPFGRG